MNISEIMEMASSVQIKYDVAQTLYKMPHDFWHWLNLGKHLAGVYRKENWWDHLTVLRSFSRLCRPATYLEVGVRKGGSMCHVLAESPGTKCYGFDLWNPDYCKVDSWPALAGSAEMVTEAIAQFNPQNNPTFIVGDSKETLPKFFADHPEFMADIALVDGDHDEAGARFDLELVLRHALIVVFDDIVHDKHPYLEKVFDEAVSKFCPSACIFKDKFCVGTAVAFSVS